MSTIPPQQTLTTTSLASDGGCLSLNEAKTWKVLNALPDETVLASLIKKRGGIRYGIANEILSSHPGRIPALETDHFTSCSPWQIMTPELEDATKIAMTRALFPSMPFELISGLTIYSNYAQRTAYRNKMEYSFYTDTETGELSLCFFQRMGTKKIPISTCILAMPSISAAATTVIAFLRALSTNTFHYKSLIIRSSQSGVVSATLFIKDAETAKIVAGAIPTDLTQWLHVAYSDRRSPASVVTERITNPPQALTDTIRAATLQYNPLGFFQVNLPVLEAVLTDIAPYINQSAVTDLYCGVGTLSLALHDSITDALLVEADSTTGATITKNIIANDQRNFQAQIGTAEHCLETITSDRTLIIDPPRAGLHTKVIDRILLVKPERIIYLSCNPTTQARDYTLLQEAYTPQFFKLYNFFPMTPHTESLLVLDQIK